MSVCLMTYDIVLVNYNCMDVIEFLLNSPVSNIYFIHLSSGYTLSKLAHFAIETNFILFYRMA